MPASIAQVTTPGAVYRPFRSAAARVELTLVRAISKELRPALVFTELVKNLVSANRRAG